LLYISRSLISADHPEMNAIARTALERNSQCGVTGFLYYDDDTFLQVLEGMPEDVDEIYAGIRRDGRHENVRTLDEAPAEKRMFGGWAMGLHDGSEGGGLLPRVVRANIARSAGSRDAPALVRFLNDLSLGRHDVRLMAAGGV